MSPLGDCARTIKSSVVSVVSLRDGGRMRFLHAGVEKMNSSHCFSAVSSHQSELCLQLSQSVCFLLHPRHLRSQSVLYAEQRFFREQTRLYSFWCWSSHCWKMYFHRS